MLGMRPKSMLHQLLGWNSVCVYGAICCSFVSVSCGEKKEVIEVVEEDQGADGTSPTAPTRLKKGAKGTRAAAAGTQGETTPGSESEEAGEPSTGAGGNGEPPSGTQTQEQLPRKPVVSWEPADISKLLTTYCAGPCHGSHGKFASKDYFLSLKDRHLIQLRAGAMPPPKLFPNFRESTDGLALITWLEQQ
jgi:hypothetical protein